MCSPVWQDPYYLKLWMYCLLKASHKEREQLVGNQIEKIVPGQFVTGRKVLEEDLNKGMKKEQKLSEITWWRYLNNLEKFQMLNIKKTNKYSVVTILNWNEYQLTEQQLNNNGTTDEQQLNTNKNVKNVKNEKKSDSSPKFEICDMENAELLLDLILKNNPEAKKPNLDKWADEFRKIRDIDNRTDEQVKYLIKWSQADGFWHKNIRSPEKLRKQWDQLVLEVKGKKSQKLKNEYKPVIHTGTSFNILD
jgi:hypothetical protein